MKITIDDFILFVNVAEATLKYVAVGYIIYYLLIIYNTVKRNVVSILN
jgi:hypothetical protein